MTRIKIDYGIDLGTTNSAICRMEKGEPVIKKTDTLKDTLPSCVSITKKKSVKVGDSAYNDMKSDKRRATKSWHAASSNTYLEFKRTMGTDQRYHSSHMERDYTSEELSAEVLKALKSFITDETFNSVVITVPAKFTVTQKTATINAARLAGFKRCELLQEPIAAAMAYGLSSAQKNGYWMVFDFGGGTFDAALLKVEDGIMQVFDTAGDNYLGGKNLDEAIVDGIIIPYLEENYVIDDILADAAKKDVLREAMKTYAEDVKNQLSFKDKEDIISNLGDLGEDDEGEEIELDLTVSQAEAFEVMRPLFQKAVDICRDLLARNNMSGKQIDKLILVGGPTHSPLIRQMLREQITPNVDTDIDPMTAVATGAALYASTMGNEVAEEEIQIGTVRLEVGYEATSVETVEFVTMKLAKEQSFPCPSRVQVELTRGDKAWSSGKVEVDELGNIIEANLVEGKANVFAIQVYDNQGNLFDCFPSEITIIQGARVGSAPLPYNIGIAIWSERKKKGVFTAMQGLEKNKPLPAVGVKNGLKTTTRLRPGVADDTVCIPIYQAEAVSEGKTAALYEHVADVMISGDEVDRLIPEDAEVDITLKVDTSEMMTMEAFFPVQDVTVSKQLDTSKHQSIEEAAKRIPRDLRDARRSLERLADEGFDTDDLQRDLENVQNEHANSSEKKAVLQHVKEVLRKIEDMEDSTEWQRLESELRDAFDRLEKANAELGNEKSTRQMNQLREQIDQVIRTKNVNIGREVLEQVNALFFSLTMLYQCMGAVRDLNNRFDRIRWKSSSRARQLLDRALANINDQPKVEILHPIVVELIRLLPPDELENAGGLLR